MHAPRAPCWGSGQAACTPEPLPPVGPAPRHLSPGPRVQPALWQGREVLDLASTVPSQVLSGASMLASLRSSLARGAGTGCPLSRVFRRRRHRQLLCVGDLVAAKLGDFPGSRPCLTGAQGPEWEGRAARGRHLLGHGRARLSSHGWLPSPPGCHRRLHGGGPSTSRVTSGGALWAVPSRVLRAGMLRPSSSEWPQSEGPGSPLP